jgi:predicted patatin/cPLA2 family phospholipase
METEEELKKDIIDFSQSGRYPRMYRLVYGDGTLSKDFYNKTRAKEFLRLDLDTQRNRKSRGEDSK